MLLLRRRARELREDLRDGGFLGTLFDCLLALATTRWRHGSTAA